jgi:hypothetical protein
MQAKRTSPVQASQAADTSFNEDKTIEQTSNNIEVCPGESDRYGDFKCNHDNTHRVCA